MDLGITLWLSLFAYALKRFTDGKYENLCQIKMRNVSCRIYGIWKHMNMNQEKGCHLPVASVIFIQCVLLFMIDEKVFGIICKSILGPWRVNINKYMIIFCSQR